MAVDKSIKDKARRRYDEARRAAQFRDIVALVTRRSDQLCPFEEVRTRLHSHSGIDRGVQSIEIEQIVGSVGRTQDFTREFLPRRDVTRERWESLDRALHTDQMLPPIEVFKLEEVYFVSDGHHRVSVARANGVTHIDAHIVELPMRVPLTPNMPPEKIILAAEYAGFLERTALDSLRPGWHIVLTQPGGYTRLLATIETVQANLQRERQGEIAFTEAACCWFDQLYQPVVEAIRREGLLRRFTGRTEADLYLWIIQHLDQLRQEYGAAVDVELAAEDLTQAQGGAWYARVARRIRRAAARLWGDDVPPIVERLVDRLEERERQTSSTE